MINIEDHCVENRINPLKITQLNDRNEQHSSDLSQRNTQQTLYFFKQEINIISVQKQNGARFIFICQSIYNL